MKLIVILVEKQSTLLCMFELGTCSKIYEKKNLRRGRPINDGW